MMRRPGLRPLIMGSAARLRNTNEIFAEPTQPPNVDIRIIPGITVGAREQYTAENDEQKEWYATVKGFCRGTAENMTALDESYCCQLKHVLF